jgi:4-hydroxy-tetrahydrodipicolinate synthase
MAAIEIPSGVWPATITPLNADKSIDWAGVDALTDWYIESGVAGLFSVGQSAEMFKLNDDERLALARRVVRRVAGQVPVLASGTFGGPIDRQTEYIKRMADTGVLVVTVIVSELANPSDDEDIWLATLERLLNLTGDIPLALYECPEPYHRLISPKALEWAARTGRFFLLKETSRSLEQVRKKLDAVTGTPLGLFNADATALLDSLKLGAKGYCGIAANFYPDLLAWLCANFEDYPEAAALLQAVMRVADPPLHFKYPISAKYYRQHAGFDMLTVSRVINAQIEAYDRRVLDAVAVLAESQRQSLARL